MKTTQDIVDDYLIRQEWNQENYPNEDLANRRKRIFIRTVEKIEKKRKEK